MKITREVITDLWPIYAAGKASSDTQALIQDFFQGDPEFAHQLDSSKVDGLSTLANYELPPTGKMKVFSRTGQLLQGRNWLLFLAMLFSCSAFGRIISDTSWDVSPVNFIIISVIAAGFWVAFLARIA